MAWRAMGLGLCGVLGAMAGAAACSPNTGASTNGNLGDDGSGGSGEITPGAGGGSTGTGSTGSGSISGAAGAFVEPVPNKADAGCVETPSRAEQTTTTTTREVTHDVTTYTPLDMYIMLDKSGSMNTRTTPTRWEAVTAAISGFVNAPGTENVGVGLQYFPSAGTAPLNCNYGDPGCNCIGLCPGLLCLCVSDSGGSCNVDDYATPAVPIQLLPGVAPAIVASLNNTSPGSGTPTRPALEGAVRYATQWAVNHPDRKTIVVLATDGQPNDCSSTVQSVSDIASRAFTGTPSIPTFVLGVGTSLDNLQAIATAGGGQAIIVDDSSGDPTQRIIDAFNAIRDSVTTSTTETITETIPVTVPVPCEWGIPPEMPAGVTFNPEEVNVKYQAGASGTPTLVGGVGSEAECAGVVDGWYFDSYENPTKVLVCPQTCTTLKGISDAWVNVVFGCQTERAIPR